MSFSLTLWHLWHSGGCSGAGVRPAIVIVITSNFMVCQVISMTKIWRFPVDWNETNHHLVSRSSGMNLKLLTIIYTGSVEVSEDEFPPKGTCVAHSLCWPARYALTLHSSSLPVNRRPAPTESANAFRNKSKKQGTSLTDLVFGCSSLTRFRYFISLFYKQCIH